MLKKWVPIWAIPVLILFSIGTVWLRLSLIRMTYAINQSEREIAKAREDRELLQVKVTALRSPRRLEALARTRFGLSQPRTDQIVHMKKSEIEGHGP